MGWVVFSADGHTISAPITGGDGICEDVVNVEKGVVVLEDAPIGELVVMLVKTVTVSISVRTTVGLFTAVSTSSYAGIVSVWCQGQNYVKPVSYG